MNRRGCEAARMSSGSDMAGRVGLLAAAALLQTARLVEMRGRLGRPARKVFAGWAEGRKREVIEPAVLADGDCSRQRFIRWTRSKKYSRN